MGDITDVVKGTALMLAMSDNEEWDKLSEELQLRYLKLETETI